MNKTIRRKTTILLATLAGVAAVLPISSAAAAERPVKELRETSISGEPWGFSRPVGVAVDPESGSEHDLYVADRSNSRIQVFTPQGVFVSMFGWEVDKTTKGNICTAVSKDECQPGQPVAGGPAGQISEPTSVTVDQEGDVYVLDWENLRVEKYTATGEFIFMIGGAVNKTADKAPSATDEQKNICTEEEIKKLNVECQSGSESPAGTNPHSEFKFERESGNLLTVDANGVLYVGDEGRVQEFDKQGQYVHEVPTSGLVEALAVDSAENLYVLEMNTIVRKFTGLGVEVKEANWPYVPKPREATGEVFLHGLAVDRSGRIATTAFEKLPPTFNPSRRSFGLLLNGATAQLITEFAAPEFVSGIGFGDSEVSGTGGFDMYLAARDEQQVLVYKPVAVAELEIEPATCTPGSESGTDVTFDCKLNGEVDPWEVADTEIFFEWGHTPALGTVTPIQVVCTTTCGNTPTPVSAMVEGLRPDETDLRDQLDAYDLNNLPPEEALRSPQSSFSTQAVPPRIVGEPNLLFVGPSSAVMFGEVNPENAETEYFIEYGPCDEPADCANSIYTNRTVASESAEYGTVASTFQVSELQPETLYHYRFAAVNQANQPAVYLNERKEADTGEGQFTTALAPKVRAETGLPLEIAATSALVSGAVDPDGQAAIYTFELGIYNGAGTQYGVVFSGPVVASTASVSEQLSFTGLQPGVEYAYRITVKSGYGESVGAARTFLTEGLPAILPSTQALGMLVVPPYEFPNETKPVPPPKCKRGYQRDKHGKCLKVKKKAKGHARGKKARGKTSRGDKHGGGRG